MDEPRPRVQRDVVSFVRRSARMNPGQQKAWTDLQHWVVPVPRRETSTSIAPDARVDWPAVFGRAAPLVVEIGGGNGDVIAALAASHPERDHVAFEVFEPAVASTLAKCRRAGVQNVRVVVANGPDALAALIDDHTLTELWTFFPDPWHKKRHHKRRLLQPPLVHMLAGRLAPGGYLHCATDWQPYAQQMLEVLGAEPLLRNTVGAADGGYAPKPDYRPLTKFENRGLKLGHGVWDLVFERRA
jgi:tRNA (guanine-N7-)-methyltransferase